MEISAFQSLATRKRVHVTADNAAASSTAVREENSPLRHSPHPPLPSTKLSVFPFPHPHSLTHLHPQVLLVLFDLILLDDRPILDLPFAERRATLHAEFAPIAGQVQYATSTDVAIPLALPPTTSSAPPAVGAGATAADFESEATTPSAAAAAAVAADTVLVTAEVA
eukprot:4641640-Prymnesium_polylepis.1